MSDIPHPRWLTVLIIVFVAVAAVAASWNFTTDYYMAHPVISTLTYSTTNMVPTTSWSSVTQFQSQVESLQVTITSTSYSSGESYPSGYPYQPFWTVNTNECGYNANGQKTCEEILCEYPYNYQQCGYPSIQTWSGELQSGQNGCPLLLYSGRAYYSLDHLPSPLPSYLTGIPIATVVGFLENGELCGHLTIYVVSIS